MFHLGFFLISWISTFVFIFRSFPAMAFVLYQLVYFFNPLTRWWGYNLPSLSYSLFTVIIMTVTLLAYLFKEKLPPLFKSPPYKWLIGLVIYHFVLMDVVVFPSVHYEYTINFLKLVVIISIAYKLIFNEKNLNLVLYGFMISCSYMAFVIYETGRNSGSRVEGIGTVDAPDANTLACAIIPSLVLILNVFWKNKTIPKPLSGICLVLVLNSFVLINSRGAFLGAATGLAFYFYHLYKNPFSSRYDHKAQTFKKNKWNRSKIFALLILCGAAFLTVVDDSFIDRIYSIQETKVDVNKESGATRTEFWKASIKVFIDNPVGVGARGFEFYSDAYLPEYLNTGAHRSRAVHSTWFEILSELGLVGSSLFVLLLFSTFQCLKKLILKFKEENDEERYYQIIALKAGFISFLVTASFINRGRAEVLYWLILFIMSAYNIYFVQNNYKKILTKELNLEVK